MTSTNREMRDQDVGHGTPRDPDVPLLRLSGIARRFGGVQALDGASLTVTRPGVVHALMGENGSGKSTMLRILSGQIRPDSGSIEIDAGPVEFHEPAAALRAGVAMVSQETSVALDLTVAENILMGQLVRRRGSIDWPATHRRAGEILEMLGLQYNTYAPVGHLRPDQRQLVEIARAISTEPRILILDEPTSSLTDDEVGGLFAAVTQLKRSGVSTLFVSHRIKEVLELADEVTILRDGRTVARGPAAEYGPHELVRAMVGDMTSDTGPASPRWPKEYSRPNHTALELRAITVPGAVTDVDLTLQAGTIVGIAGLVGAGRSELLEVIFGLRRRTRGTMSRDGRPYAPSGPRDAAAAGVAYVPPERRTQGLVLTMSIGDNLTMAATCKRSRLAPPDDRLAEQAYLRATQRVRLRAPSRFIDVGALSGGNQQKVAIGKALELQPRVLLLDEPTRGVDVSAKADIHERLLEAASHGVAMLVSSSENTELLDLCDHIIVMFRGRVVSSVAREDATEAVLARLAGGHQ